MNRKKKTLPKFIAPASDELTEIEADFLRQLEELEQKRWAEIDALFDRCEIKEGDGRAEQG